MFCYVCREFIAEAQKRTKTTEIKKIYNQYFDCPLGDQDKLWAPHVVCSSGLRDWYNSRKKYIPFSIAMIWREPKAHLTDCYFCKVNITRYSTKNKHKTVYSNLNSAMRLAHHTGSLLSHFDQMLILKHWMMILTVPTALPIKITYQMTMTLNLIGFLKLN